MYRKDRNKTVSERTTWPATLWNMWNISVVVCNLAGLDKNWTDFKKKKADCKQSFSNRYDPCSQWIQCLELMLWQYQTEPKAHNFLAGDIRLCTGIADKIEVVTIATDEKTILEIIATIALPYSDQV